MWLWMEPDLFTHLGCSFIRPWTEGWLKSHKTCIVRKCKKLIVTEEVMPFKLSKLFISEATKRTWVTLASEKYCKCISNLILFYRYYTAQSSLFISLSGAESSLQFHSGRKEWVCCPSLAGIAGLNPSGDVDACCGCCVCQVGLTARPKGSYRVWCVWVWSRNLVEEAHVYWGCRAMRKKKPVNI